MTSTRVPHIGRIGLPLLADASCVMSNRPLLRAPPFPGACFKGGPRRTADLPFCRAAPDRQDAILAALRKSRVGGSFWRETGEDTGFDTLLRPSSVDDIRHFLSSGHLDRQRTIIWSAGRRLPRTGKAARFLSGDHDPWPLIERATTIIAAPEDEVALLAGLLDKRVIDPTTNTLIDPALLRDRLVQRIETFDYSDPYFGRPIDSLDWIGLLSEWRATIEKNRSIAVVAGIAGWKRDSMRRFLWSGQSPQMARAPDPQRLATGKAIGIWPSRVPATLIDRAKAANVPIVRIEDGFVRSIGLGSHLHPPRSIVVDLSGIYYDPAQPSDLEHILSHTDFDHDLRLRAAALVDALVAARITKYAAGRSGRVTLPPAARRILVPGQVEDDLSVRHGRAGVTGNLDLLRRVRAAEPDAWIGYRPHPDVATGLRKGRIEESEALHYADAVLHEGVISDLLDQVDAVHVLTSLAGFEALMRGREVVTHGQPFYAGWGLTTDLAPPVTRRQRKLRVEDLVAGALILYPRYLDPVTGLPCSPEILVQRHAVESRPRPTLLNRFRALQGQFFPAGRGAAGMTA